MKKFSAKTVIKLLLVLVFGNVVGNSVGNMQIRDLFPYGNVLKQWHIETEYSKHLQFIFNNNKISSNKIKSYFVLL